MAAVFCGGEDADGTELEPETWDEVKERYRNPSAEDRKTLEGALRRERERAAAQWFD